MNKLKKIFCVTLCSVLLVNTLILSAGAFSQVDLSRIKFSGSDDTLVFRFGGLEIFGQLHRMAPFEEGQVEKIIIETMEETGITEADLYESKQLIEKVKGHAEITQEDMQRIRENLLTSASTVPAAGAVVSVLSMINGYMNSSNLEDVGIATVNVFESSAIDWVKDTATGYIEKNGGEIGEKVLKLEEWRGNLVAIATFCDMLANEYARDKQKWTDIADAANAKRKANEFYTVLQENIDKAMSESEEKGWEIDFDSKGGTGHGAFTEREFPFFGVDGNKQTWYLDMKLKQTSTDAFGSVVGIYEGAYVMRAEHKMDKFSENIDKAAKQMDHIKDLIKAYEKDPMFEVNLSTPSPGSVYISRTINGTAKVEIDKSGEITLTLNEQSDTTQVIFSDIVLEMSVGVKAEGLGVLAGMTFPMELGNDEECIVIKSSTMNITDHLADFNFDINLSGSGEGRIGWDDEIWRHWDGSNSEKTLSHVG